MPKRKRPSHEEIGVPSGSNEDSLPSLQYARLHRQIEISQHSLHAALRLARGFERQKLGRRQKTAETDKKKDILFRLGAEVRAIKRLDLPATAKNLLQKQLSKVKRIAESPTFHDYISKQEASQAGRLDETTTTVVARLLNSNPVKTVLPGIIDSVREILGLEKSEKHSTESQDQKGRSSRLANASSKPPGRVVPDSSTTSEWEGIASDPKNDVDTQESVSEQSFEEYDTLLASSESDSGKHSEREVSSSGRPDQPSSYHPTDDLSLSSAPSDASSVESLPRVKQTKASKQAKNTTFLPSLMGGYWSGSESAEDEPLPGPQQRKNRMGQQARRALWEKKYGKKANHLKKEVRDSGWDPKRGATDGDHRGRRGRGRGQAVVGRVLSSRGNGNDRTTVSQVTGSNNHPVNLRRNLNTEKQGSLHPSWVAAQKAKEQKNTAGFKGKKITFE